MNMDSRIEHAIKCRKATGKNAGMVLAPATALVLGLLAWTTAGQAQSRDTVLTLVSQVFQNTRSIRVLLPPGYHDPANAGLSYPVFYFTDGVAAWDIWGVPVVADSLWAGGAIPPYIFIGIDNGGSTLESTAPARDRASEYLPFPDPTWTDAPPEPQGDRFPAFLFDEVMPLVAGHFRVDANPLTTGLAGDSYAGVVTLYTGMQYPERLGLLLVESPSLHVGDGQLLRDAASTREWPVAMYLGVGTAEGDTPAIRQDMVQSVRQLERIVRRQAPGTRVGLLVIEGGTHWYDAWRDRLPRALTFLLAGADME